MKKLSLLLLMFVFLANVNGQYTPMLKTGNQWNVLRDYVNPTHFSEIMKADSDTLVDGRICKKVVSTRDTSTSAVFEKRCLLFEDTVSRKIFTLDDQNNIRLYFDFGVQLGDSMALYSPLYNSTDTFIVSQASYVNINNSTRIMITLDYYSSNFYMQNVDSWIEGIGSLKGLIYGNISPEIMGSQYSLLCMSNSSQTLYQNTNFTQCYYTNVKIEEFERNSISIFPNPVINNEFWIKSNSGANTSNVEVELFDIYGKLVLKTSVDINQNPISTANLPKGIYLYKIANGLKQMGFGKIIVL
jgi:hypothetical protein